MGMTRKIEIDGKEVLFKASAAILRIYRVKFQRDIYKDLSALKKQSVKMWRTHLRLIHFHLRCLRTSLM